MPVEEAIELIALLGGRVRRRPEAVVVNGLYPPAPALDAARGPPEALRLWIERRRANEREIARLAAAWSGPRVELPLLALERGPNLVAALGRQLGECA
jgi:hypothetical protein